MLYQRLVRRSRIGVALLMEVSRPHLQTVLSSVVPCSAVMCWGCHTQASEGELRNTCISRDQRFHTFVFQRESSLTEVPGKSVRDHRCILMVEWQLSAREKWLAWEPFLEPFTHTAFPARFWLGRLSVLDGARGQGAGGEGLWGTGCKEEEETVRLQGNSPLAPLLHGDFTFLDAATMRRNLVVRLPGRRGAGVLPAPLFLVSKAAQSSR